MNIGRTISEKRKALRLTQQALAEKNVSEKKIGGNTVTLKGNGDGVSSATWTSGTYSYSIYSENELTNKLVESIVAAMR